VRVKRSGGGIVAAAATTPAAAPCRKVKVERWA